MIYIVNNVMMVIILIIINVIKIHHLKYKIVKNIIQEHNVNNVKRDILCKILIIVLK